MAFDPPKPAGYHLTRDKRALIVGPGYELSPLPDLSSVGIRVDVVRMWTRRKNTIYGFHLKSVKSTGTILFSHGNSTDIGGPTFPFLVDLCINLQADVFAYDYSGYGESSGVPSELDMYADVDAAYHYLTQDVGTAPHKIFVCGQSIGTVPSTDLASRRDVGGLILISALKSGLGMIHDVKTSYWFDVFRNIEKIKQVRAPVFIIHGTYDQQVPIEHSVELYEECPPEWAFEPWWVEGFGHNDIATSENQEFFTQLKHFVQECHSADRRWGAGKYDDDDGDSVWNSARGGA